MSILSETTHYVSYYFFLIVVSSFALLTLVISIGLIFSMIIEKYFELNEFLGFFVMGVIGAFLSFGVYVTTKEGADITYKATVTDFNEVYQKGYEVIDRDGDLFTLKKR